MRERSDRSGGAERRRAVCVHRRQLSGCWGGVRAVEFGGCCGRKQGDFRAVWGGLGRFRAVRAVGSRGSCGRTRAGGIPPRRS